MYPLLNYLGGSSVCFGSIETLCFSIEAKQPKHQNKLFRNKPKKLEKNRKNREKNRKNRKNHKFSVKKGKFAPYQAISVCLLFVSVQSKHRNSLFRYRSETTETYVVFRIVPKQVSVPVSVVSNRN